MFLSQTRFVQFGVLGGFSLVFSWEQFPMIETFLICVSMWLDFAMVHPVASLVKCVPLAAWICLDELRRGIPTNQLSDP